MFREPAARLPDDRLERSRLFEEVHSAGHDHQLLCATELGERGAIERQHIDIIATDDQQGRSYHDGKSRPGQVRAAATRDDRPNGSLMRRSERLSVSPPALL